MFALGQSGFVRRAKVELQERPLPRPASKHKAPIDSVNLSVVLPHVVSRQHSQFKDIATCAAVSMASAKACAPLVDLSLIHI